METLANKITINQETAEAANLTDRFTEADLDIIGRWVVDGFTKDKTSRWKWERRMQAAMDLAMQVQKDKSFPWPNCSNVQFPLVTIASLQFHSRAYPTVINGSHVAKMRVIGPDPLGEKQKRADRISTHMSWQVLEQDKAWEEQKDRLLINLPIVGCVFTKSFYNASLGYNVDETVLAQNLVMNYFAKSVESCQRKTHIIQLYKNDIHSRIARGTYRDVKEQSWYKQPAPSADQEDQARVDKRAGLTPPMTDETTPFQALEQHVRLDLDQDGYAEPWIITVEQTSGCVLRIVAGWDSDADIDLNTKGEIIEIRSVEYFTKYSFIPSPDGSIYDVGFGILLGPLNESVNSLVNQLTDAGTMQTTKGGFLGRGAKIRGGVYTFAPLEWKRVDSDGDDLRKNIVPLEVGEPSTVLFQLLSLLINYVQRISGTTDPMVGESTGQNTPAETTRSMISEGPKIYSAIFKRVWRSIKQELKKRYILNGKFLPIRSWYGVSQLALKEDYLANPDDIVPAADPNITSDEMAMNQAVTLKQAAGSTPGYDIVEVEHRFLRALKIDDPEKVYPGPEKTGMPKDPKVQIQELKNEMAQMELEAEQLRWQSEMQEEMRMNDAEIIKITAEIKAAEETLKGDVMDRQVAMLQSLLKAREGKNNVLLTKLDIVKKQLEIRREQVKASAERGAVGRLEGTSGNGGSSGSAKTKKAA